MRPRAPTRRPRTTVDEPGWPSDRIPAPPLPGADRSTVLAGLNGLVSAGRAEWQPLPGGATMVRLATGQCFRLDDEGITRSR